MFVNRVITVQLALILNNSLVQLELMVLQGLVKVIQVCVSHAHQDTIVKKDLLLLHQPQ